MKKVIKYAVLHQKEGDVLALFTQDDWLQLVRMLHDLVDYLPLDGSKKMTGDLDIDTNSIETAQLRIYEYSNSYIRIAIKGTTTARDLFARRVIGTEWLKTLKLIPYSGNEITLDGKWLGDLNHIELDEITTPTAVTDHGKVYTKNDNKLYFQDGAGTEHEIAFV